MASIAESSSPERVGLSFQEPSLPWFRRVSDCTVHPVLFPTFRQIFCLLSSNETYISPQKAIRSPFPIIPPLLNPSLTNTNTLFHFRFPHRRLQNPGSLHSPRPRQVRHPRGESPRSRFWPARPPHRPYQPHYPRSRFHRCSRRRRRSSQGRSRPQYVYSKQYLPLFALSICRMGPEPPGSHAFPIQIADPSSPQN